MSLSLKKFAAVCLLIIVLCISAVTVTVGVLIFTDQGSAFVVRKAIKVFHRQKQPLWRESRGSLLGGMVFDDIVLEDVPGLPAPNLLKVQRLAVDVDSPEVNGVQLDIQNARLTLPYSEPILLYGTLHNGQVDLTVFCSRVSIEQIKSLLPPGALRELTGEIVEADFVIKGPVTGPTITGSARIRKLTKGQFTVEEVPLTVNLQLEKDKKPGLFGEVTIESGTVRGRKTALVELQNSEIYFHGNPREPSFHVQAKSAVDRIKMNITLNGTMQNPDIGLSSNPPLPKERILLVLATNQTWQATEDQLYAQELSPAVAKDFLSYFVFGGSGGNAFAKRFGLKSVSVDYGADKKGIRVTKDVLDRVEGSYAVEKGQDETATSVKQTVGAELNVTDKISVDAQRSLETINDPAGETTSTTQSEILLKFKTPF